MLHWYFKVTYITLTENRSKNKFFSSVSPVESMLSWYFKITDVTLTEKRNKNKFFLKDHHCQCITSGRCVLPYTSMSQISLKLKTETRSSSFQRFITVSVSPVESVLLWHFKVTDVTLTENRKKNKFFSKVHNCQCITSGKCFALILLSNRCHFNWKQKQEQVLFKSITVSVSPVESVLPWYINAIDVTLTENRNKNKLFSKVHNCQWITTGRRVAFTL